MVLTVLLADDHGVIRDGVRRLLESNMDIKVVGTADDGVEAVAKTEELAPNVVVMDVSLPKLNGIDATRSIMHRAPGTGVVMLSMHSSSEIVRQALLAGARGYLLKESAGEEVVRAVRAVAGGKRFLGEGISGKVHPEFPYAPTGSDPTDALTRRERDVLHLIADGKSNAEAAAVLGLSPRSVETYRARLMQKLGIEDLPGLVKFAIRHGMTTLE